jgi:hypothetical protein
MSVVWGEIRIMNRSEAEVHMKSVHVLALNNIRQMFGMMLIVGKNATNFVLVLAQEFGISVAS